MKSRLVPPFVLFVLSMVSCNMIAGKTESVPPESLEDALLQVATAIDTNPSTGDLLQSGEAEVESIELEEAENDYPENDYPGNDSSEGDYIDAPVIKDINDLRKIEEKAREAKEFVAQNGMNQDWCLLLDFSYDLYTRRLIVYDLKSNEIIRRELVSHGNGGGSTPSKPVFSNVEGSFCSSLGKYKIGKRAYSNWGIHVHYKLHGLEPTNSNAFRRIIVLHSYASAYCDYPTTASNGCPIVCDDVMRYLDEKLKQTTKPTLLWIYE